MRRPVMAVAAVLIAGGGGLVLAGCGSEGATTSSTAPQRSTAGDGLITCPEQQRFVRYLTVRNTTADPIILNAGDVECDGWSGTGNPSIFNNRQLMPGAEFRGQLNRGAEAPRPSYFTLYLGRTAQQRLRLAGTHNVSDFNVLREGAGTSGWGCGGSPTSPLSVLPGPYGDSFSVSMPCEHDPTLTIGYAPNGTGRITTDLNFLPAPGTIKPRGFGKITFPDGTEPCELTNCKRRFPTGQTVTMRAVPNPGSTFTGWGDTKCGSIINGACRVTVTDRPQDVTASFEPAATG